MKALLAIGTTLTMLLTGCATSLPFQHGAAAAGPTIAMLGTFYVSSDKTITPAVQAQRLAQIAQLESATSVAKSVTEPATESAFDAVDAWLAPYITNDSTIDATERADRLLPLVYMQQAIAAEKSRKFGSHATAN